MIFRYPLLMFILLIFTLNSPAIAEPLAAPQGRVILQISGNIKNTNVDGEAHFDRAMLEALNSATVKTETPWTEGLAEFKGPLGAALLELTGAEGSNLRAIALNDYAVDIPLSDFNDYDVILAMSKDGERLHTRTRGPLWVIYPWNDQPQLKGDAYYSRSIWQLRRIVIE